MPYATFSTPVNASLNTLWTVLLNKIEAPEKYMMGVEQVEILEEFENGVVRRVITEDMQLNERIQINTEAGEVVYTLLDHPLFTGDVINRVLAPEAGMLPQPVLTFTVDWQAKNEEAKQLEQLYEQELASGMEQAALYLKGLAEHLEQNTATAHEHEHHHEHLSRRAYPLMVSVLFVCMGNICRSPSAEAAFLQQVVKAGLKEHIHIQSAGTHDYHIGQGADKRSVEFAFKRGIDLSQHRAQQVKLEDFDQFDYILFMDEVNYKHLKGICPKALSHKMHYFLEYAPHLNLKEVPDPYYGGADGFEHVLDLVEAASEGLLNHICQHDLLKESGTSQ